MHEECRGFFEKISEYLDGELDSDTCREIEAHLRECPECEKCFDSLKKTVDICKKYPREEIPLQVRQRLLETLRARMNREGP
jgi:mycothiol system anti-sigma-R factor